MKAIHIPASPDNSLWCALSAGFTLIELSIVLVIIGLIVGGVLVGQDLIRAAGVRATITQVEKYNTAANTFRGKYGALPGDIPPTLVTQFGFTAAPVRAGTAGRGDGNGELDGYASQAYSWNQSGETLFFWEDLSANSGLIEGSFNTFVDGSSSACSTPSACSVFMPPAKLGGGNVVYVYSGYASQCCFTDTGFGPNFYGLSIINALDADGNVNNGVTPPQPGLTVNQAYSIDKKMDDGLPTTGSVLAQYLGPGGWGGVPQWAPYGTSASSSTCFDTTSNQYSVNQSNGLDINCALSFQFQ